jgi:RNA polymerase sigma factor (sigma-70 family)
MQSEAELLVLAAQVDEDLYLSRALEANLGMMVERAATSRVSGLEHEELMSEMKISAIKAIRNYKPKAGRWSSYLHLCLKHSMRNLIKQRQNKERHKMDNLAEYQEWHPEHDGEYEQAQTIYWPIDGLAVKHGALLEMRHLHEHTYKHLALVFGGCTQSALNKLASAVKQAQSILGIQLKTRLGYDKKHRWP